MSRGFVKEEDQEEAPFIPPRAALPDGIANYVTPAGYQALLNEKKELEIRQKQLPKKNDTARRRASMEIDGRLKLLVARIRSARVIDLKKQPKNEVRFGARVKFKMDGRLQEFQIVGVDEADIKQHKVAFIAPIAKILIGKKVGESANFKLGKEMRKLKIISITYPKD